MLFKLRHKHARLIAPGSQLLLMFVGLKLDSREGWLGVLPLILLISLFSWLAALKRLRTIRGTPTSKIASAAQGYVELIGRGQPFDEPMISKLRVLPCLWYRYRVEKRTSSNKWQTIDSGESTDSFVLRDDSGDCIVDPEYAEIISKHRDTWLNGEYRCTEWKLIHHDRIYVIGDFHTRNLSTSFNTRAELNALLAEWKQDKPTLHKRFDLNEDGEINMEEWMLARLAAKREVAKQKRALASQADVHTIGAPSDGQLFLISNFTPEKLSRRYLFSAWAHIVVFFGMLGGFSWVLNTLE